MRPPVALTIAGSDPSGGAGIQADLKTFSALGAYGTSVIVALTAQSTTGVSGVHTVPVDFVKLQLDTLLSDVRIDAVKIGMLGSRETVETIARYLRGPLADKYRVLDPVMVSTSGSHLLAEDAVNAVRSILDAADVITPNVHEAAVLLNEPVAETLTQLRGQGERLLALGAQRVLMKGGHLSDGATDLLVTPEGVHELSGHRVATRNTHGTGCTLSSGMAALRPQCVNWVESAIQAKAYLTGALERADELVIGFGPGPTHHFHRWW